jgi:putative RNA 2'-phosphotransferase
MNKNLENISRKLSKILRHNPHPLTMDDKGWVKTSELCEHFAITIEELTEIVDTNDKKRFVLDDVKESIRAAQGHSAGVAENKEYVRITAMQTELELYHGTDNVSALSIQKATIVPGKRQFVHWTANIETAKKRARQTAFHGKSDPVIVVLKARSYIHGSGKLLMAENEVYLTPEIDGKILEYRPI